MAKNSKIQWTTHSWNPWVGCKKVSSGCANCYMFRDAVRFGHDPTEIRRTKDKTFFAPLKYRQAYIFTCSWSDFFIADADAWRQDAWRVIERSPQLTFQILTKRPERIKECLPVNWGQGWKNVWLGVSIENEKVAASRLQELASVPSALRFVSYEPALGPVDWAKYIHLFDWLIAGGESGPRFRRANIDWFRAARDICAKNGKPFFFKQLGGIDKGENLLDRRCHLEIPPLSPGGQMSLFEE